MSIYKSQQEAFVININLSLKSYCLVTNVIFLLINCTILNTFVTNFLQNTLAFPDLKFLNFSRVSLTVAT